MATSPWEFGLSLQANNTGKCLNKSEHANILEAIAKNPRQMLIEESNSMLGHVLDHLKVESKKPTSNMTGGSDSTSTSYSTSDPVHSTPKLLNSVLDSLPNWLSE